MWNLSFKIRSIYLPHCTSNVPVNFVVKDFFADWNGKIKKNINQNILSMWSVGQSSMSITDFMLLINTAIRHKTITNNWINIRQRARRWLWNPINIKRTAIKSVTEQYGAFNTLKIIHLPCSSFYCVGDYCKASKIWAIISISDAYPLVELKS